MITGTAVQARAAYSALAKNTFTFLFAFPYLQALAASPSCSPHANATSLRAAAFLVPRTPPAQRPARGKRTPGAFVAVSNPPAARPTAARATRNSSRRLAAGPSLPSMATEIPSAPREPGSAPGAYRVFDDELTSIAGGGSSHMQAFGQYSGMRAFGPPSAVAGSRQIALARAALDSPSKRPDESAGTQPRGEPNSLADLSRMLGSPASSRCSSSNSSVVSSSVLSVSGEETRTWREQEVAAESTVRTGSVGHDFSSLSDTGDEAELPSISRLVWNPKAANTFQPHDGDVKRIPSGGRLGLSPRTLTVGPSDGRYRKATADARRQQALPHLRERMARGRQ